MDTDELAFNLSRIENDEFVDGEISVSAYDTRLTIIIISDIIKFLISICGISANLFLIITILRFKKLKTRINMYILHYAILHVLSFLLTPIIEIILAVSSLYSYGFCWIWMLGDTCIMFSFVIIFILAVDWMFMTFKNNWILRTQKCYKYIIPIIYLLAFIWWFFHGYICNLLEHTNFVLRVLYFILSISMISFNLYIYKYNVPQESKNTIYAITISNVAIFSHLPLYILHFIMDFVMHNLTVLFVFELIEIVLSFCAYASPIVIVYLLGQKSKHFKMAYDISFKKVVKTYQTDDLDISSEDPVHNSEYKYENSVTVPINT